VPEVNNVMSLKNKDDFLMHGVVLQNRVFRPLRRDVSRETSLRKRTVLPSARRPMFHVKPFSPAPLTHPRVMFHVKHFCVKAALKFPPAAPG